MTATLSVVTQPGRLVSDHDPYQFAHVPGEKDFETMIGPDEKDIRDYRPAPDLADLVRQLVEHYECLSHLRPLRIECLWRRKGGNDRGRPAFGKVQKTPGLVKHYRESDYTLWMAADHCRILRYWQLEAAVFHQLLHTGMNDEGDPTIYGHDFEGFGEELKHYGAWTMGLKLARREITGQLPLFAEGE